jgi:hypothetical protein
MALPPGVTEVSRVAAPGGGVIILGSDGGIFNEGGSPFYGSMVGFGPQGDTLYGQHQYDRNSLRLDPATGGYEVVDTEGRKYDFDPTAEQRAQKPASNPLYQDPAFQAFVRSSGLGLDIAAADIDRQIAASNRAYTAKVSDMTDPNYGSIAQGRENLNNSFETRGVLRSGARDVAANRYDVAQGKTLADMASQQSGQVADLRGQMSRKIADVATQGAERGLDVGANQEYQAGLDSLRKRYPQVYGSGS